MPNKSSATKLGWAYSWIIYNYRTIIICWAYVGHISVTPQYVQQSPCGDTKQLGNFGMRWSSKYTGIGNCERQWGHLKHLKTGKRSHLSSRAAEMQSIIYSTARINEARIWELEFENNVAGEASMMWSDDDVNFDLMLENFGVDTTVLRSVSRKRLFKC